MLMLDLRTCLLAVLTLPLAGAIAGQLLWSDSHPLDLPPVAKAATDASPELPNSSLAMSERHSDSAVSSIVVESESDHVVPFGRRLAAWFILVIVTPFAFNRGIRGTLRKESNRENMAMLGMWVISSSGMAWLLWASVLTPWLALTAVGLAAVLATGWFTFYCGRLIHWVDEH
jgi:hypothetical protein